MSAKGDQTVAVYSRIEARSCSAQRIRAVPAHSATSHRTAAGLWMWQPYQ